MPLELHEDYVAEKAKVLRESPKALLIRFDGQEMWVPKSCIHDDSEVFDAKDNAEGKLVLKGWFAADKGLL